MGRVRVPARRQRLRALLTAEGSPTDLPGALDPEILNGPKVHIPGRDFILFRGPISALTNFGHSPWPDTFWFQGPNLWWPEDGAWYVASEIDFAWTYVGGPTPQIRRILDHPRSRRCRPAYATASPTTATM